MLCMQRKPKRICNTLTEHTVDVVAPKTHHLERVTRGQSLLVPQNQNQGQVNQLDQKATAGTHNYEIFIHHTFQNSPPKNIGGDFCVSAANTRFIAFCWNVHRRRYHYWYNESL